MIFIFGEQLKYGALYNVYLSSLLFSFFFLVHHTFAIAEDDDDDGGDRDVHSSKNNN